MPHWTCTIPRSKQLGGAFNQAPDSLVAALNRRDCDVLSAQRSRMASKIWWMMGLSQAAWRVGIEGADMPSGVACFHADQALTFSRYETVDNDAGSNCRMSSEAPSADGKKADGAKVEALWNPSPPTLTGRVACSQVSLQSKSMLVILHPIYYYYYYYYI